MRDRQNKQRRKAGPPTTADDLLFNFHANSGAAITMNSRRLRHLPRFMPEEEAFCSAEEYSAYATASEAVAQDIRDYAHVDLDDAADCVRRFAKKRHDAGDMYVCALCGLRDPEVEYTQYDLQDAIDARTRDDDSQPVRPWLQVRSMHRHGYRIIPQPVHRTSPHACARLFSLCEFLFIIIIIILLMPL